MDMSGNVWEWVSSLYQPYPYDENDEIISDNSNAHVLRGGSWGYDDTTDLRAPNRDWLYPVIENDVRGFRCIRSYSL